MKLPIIGRAILACAFMLFAAQARAAEPTKLLIAHGAISNNVEPLWIAKEHEIFRKYGIDPELAFIIAGRAMQAMLAGQVPVGLLGATHVINVATSGGDFGFQVENMEETLKSAQASGAQSEADKKPRDGRFAEMGIQDPTGTPVDVSVHGWKA
jgi:ABC-type nitrate/sulfonate/bicarbonate transport system substrate-binding protein